MSGGAFQYIQNVNLDEFDFAQFDPVIEQLDAMVTTLRSFDLGTEAATDTQTLLDKLKAIKLELSLASKLHGELFEVHRALDYYGTGDVGINDVLKALMSYGNQET
ncbi:MAG: hypothetical protein HQL94_04285 [Magnetococcales bacterium]|nr:hypothetical protein [Magnetococcales bacterium]MBF0439079.1 hypothetical protein [Magnetococcales bacterium]